MPPANDNWASATVLAGSSGSTTGNNILATAQVGEPANSGKTVWYKWTSGLSPVATYFDTRQNTLATPLRTILRVYTGAAVNALTEVTYITTANWPTNYAHWDIGSLVAFDPAASTDYYIRVDGVGGAEGNFPLVYGNYFNITGNSCTECAPTYGLGYQCKGTVQQATLSGPTSTSFGTFPQGRYIVKYCHGAWKFENAIANGWGVNTWILLVANADQFTFTYQSAGTPTVVHPANMPPQTSANKWGYYSQAEAEIAFRCLYAAFDHDGGAISMEFTDNPYTDNAPGNPNPTFGLYLLTPHFTASTACATWTVVGTSVSCTFTILNQNDAPWNNVTATLRATGGVSSPSAPVTGLNFAANGTATATFTFNASTANVIGTLKFSSTYFPADITVDFNLNPVFTVDTLVISGGTASCSGHLNKILSVIIHNSGYWTVNPDMLADLGGVKQIMDPSCNGHTNLTINPGDVTCAGGTQTPFIRYLTTGVTASATLTVAVSHLGVNYGTTTFPLTTV